MAYVLENAKKHPITPYNKNAVDHKIYFLDSLGILIFKRQVNKKPTIKITRPILVRILPVEGDTIARITYKAMQILIVSFLYAILPYHILSKALYITFSQRLTIRSFASSFLILEALHASVSLAL